MPERDDPFSPHHVDESIEHTVSDGASPVQERTHADILVNDMQKLYHIERGEYLRALQRVEDRLVERYATSDKRAVADPAALGPRQRSPRQRSPRNIQQGRFKYMEYTQPSKFGRSLSLLVAGLIMALLVGGLITVLNITHPKPVAHQQPKHTDVGAVQRPTLTPVPVPTFGKTLYTTPGNQFGFSELAWSPDSKRIASYTDSVQIWDATTGHHRVTVQLPNGGYPSALAWAPNSQQVAIGTSSGVVIANGQSGAIIHTYGITMNPSDLHVASNPRRAMLPVSGGLGVRGLSWSHDGRFLAVAISAGPVGTIEVLNAQTGAQAYTLPITGNYVPTALAWSFDNKYIAASTFNTEPGMQTVPPDEQQMVWAWKISTRQVVFKHTGGNGTGDPLSWQPGSDKLAFSMMVVQKGVGTIVELGIWNVAANKLFKQFDVAAFGPVAWSPDGTYLAYGTATSGNAGLIGILDVNSGQQIYTYTQMHSNIGALSWSPDGKYIASGEGNTSGNMVAKVWTA